jgi:hypothetical protein
MFDIIISGLLVLLVAVSVYGVILMFKGWKLLEQSEKDVIGEVVGSIVFVLMMFALLILAVSI